MPDPSITGAVFLSYAREDAAAARRIAEALRASGVEVWFDEDELRGGDAWDAKIRQQIRECALFMPIISASTQARPEGYFRLEWKLADRRMDLIGKSKAFLLPVCIDDTPEGHADVPDSFLAVQWVRLRNGEATSAFCGRVQALLDGGAARERIGHSPRGPETVASSAPKGIGRSRLAGVIALTGVAVVALAVWQPWRTTAGVLSPAPGAAPGRTEAQELVAKARAIFQDGEEVKRESFFFAEDFLKQAVKVEVANAEAWAVFGQLSVDLYRFGFDRSTARIEAIRSQVDRALRLDPDSIEAQVAQASAADYLGLDPNAAEASLRRLAQRSPNNRLVLQALARKLGRSGKIDEAVATANRAAALTHDNSSAWEDVAPYALAAGRYDEAEELASKSLARRSSGRALAIDALLKLGWRGDSVAAAAAIARWPGWFLLEDRGGAIAGLVALWNRDPGKALSVYQRLPRDYLRDTYFTGPRAALTAFAHQQAGHSEAARADWQLALQVAERESAAGPSDGHPLYWRARALAELGDSVGAEALRSQINQRNWIPTSYYSPDGGLPGLALALGDVVGATAALERALAPRSESEPLFKNFYLNYSLPRGVLELNPVFDRLRGDERFKRLLAKAPAPRGVGKLAAAEQKSVAVLAFENRSSEKDSEYFSDGISEEILNVLAKVPGLRVVGRASSFQFKGAKVAPAEIAQKLNVSYLVEGSVQRSGTRARITAQLTRANTGDTLWVDKFDTELKDIFKAQDEIAELIAQKLSLTLGMSTRTRPVNPEAHRLLLEGRHLWNLRTGQGLRQAESFFARAAALAPDFAELHADWALLELIGANTTSAWFGNLDMAADIQRSRTRAQRALQLDPTSGEAMAALAYSMQLDGTLDESERLFRRAIELRPNSSAIHSWFAQLLATQGDLAGGLEEHAKAYKLDPLSATHVGVYVADLVRARKYSEAIQIGERIALLHPTFVPTRAALGRAYLAVGKNKEAVEQARFVLEHPEYAPRWQSDIFAIAVLTRLGEVEVARRHAARLRTTLVAGSFMQGYVLVAEGRFAEALPMLTRVPSLQARGIFYDEMWDRWRDDPRFSAFIAQLGFGKEYQRAREQLAVMAEPAAKR